MARRPIDPPDRESTDMAEHEREHVTLQEGATEPETVQEPFIDPANQPASVQLRTSPEPLVGPGHEPGAPLPPLSAKTSPDEATVRMRFPHPVLLTDDNHVRILFPEGLVDVPVHLADHWYLGAHGAVKET